MNRIPFPLFQSWFPQPQLADLAWGANEELQWIRWGKLPNDLLSYRFLEFQISTTPPEPKEMLLLFDCAEELSLPNCSRDKGAFDWVKDCDAYSLTLAPPVHPERLRLKLTDFTPTGCAKWEKVNSLNFVSAASPGASFICTDITLTD